MSELGSKRVSIARVDGNAARVAGTRTGRARDQGKVTRVGASERAANEFQWRNDRQTQDHAGRLRLQMVPGWRWSICVEPTSTRPITTQFENSEFGLAVGAEHGKPAILRQQPLTMRDETLAIRREITLKWRNDWRQHAPNPLTHGSSVLPS